MAKESASPPAAPVSRYERAELSPGLALWQVATVWQRAVRAALSAVGLTHAQFVLLASTAWLAGQSEDPVTQAQVAAHARTDAVMTSEVLRTLERRGLVERRAHPTDARARQLAVTPEGLELARRAMALVEGADERFFGEAGPELRALARILCSRGLHTTSED